MRNYINILPVLFVAFFNLNCSNSSDIETPDSKTQKRSTASKKTEKILYMIPQTHSPEEHGEKITEDVVQSQIKIGDFFSSLETKAIVFNEDNFNDGSMESRDAQFVLSIIQNLKNTLHEHGQAEYIQYVEICLKLLQDSRLKLSELNENEKFLIARYGSPRTLYCSNRISKLKKSVPNEETGEELYEKVEILMNLYEKENRKMQLTDTDPLYKALNTDREILALNEVNKFFNDHPNENTAYIIYGSGHDFRRHQERYPNFKIVLHPHFLKDTHFWEDLAH